MERELRGDAGQGGPDLLLCGGDGDITGSSWMCGVEKSRAGRLTHESRGPVMVVGRPVEEHAGCPAQAVFRV